MILGFSGQRFLYWSMKLPLAAAYLEDRIAMYERRPQRFGTQWLDDTRDGRNLALAYSGAGRV